jgi:glutathione S-transferase
MKLYDFNAAPNARRASMFVAEKGLNIPRVEVDLAAREQMGEDYEKVNAYRQIPALELDDGTVITESSAICLYLERLHPEPCLMGSTPLQQAQILMWDRRMELTGQQAIADAFRNANAFFAGRAMSGPDDFAQIPELAERGRIRAERFFDRLDTLLGDRRYVVGDEFSIADITAFVAVDFARVIRLRPAPEQENLTRWYQDVGSRPSAVATAAR